MHRRPTAPAHTDRTPRSITQIDRLLCALSVALVARPLAEYLDVIIHLRSGAGAAGGALGPSTFNALWTFNVLNDF